MALPQHTKATSPACPLASPRRLLLTVSRTVPLLASPHKAHQEAGTVGTTVAVVVAGTIRGPGLISAEDTARAGTEAAVMAAEAMEGTLAEGIQVEDIRAEADMAAMATEAVAMEVAVAVEEGIRE